MRPRLVVYAAGVLVAALLAGVVAWRVLGATSAFEQALRRLPASTLRATYTDWAHVRSVAGGERLGAGASEQQVAGFLSRAYDRDLTGGSALTDSTYALAKRFGFSPLDAQWEVLGQSRRGQVDVLRLDDGVDLAGIERRLRRLGYAPPAAGAGTGGTWVGSPDLVAGLDDALTPVQQNVVVLPDEHLVLMSDDAAYASAAAEVVRGDAGSLADARGVGDLADGAGDPVAATLWSGTFACEDLSMGAAYEDDQQTGVDLVAKAGGVSPVEGLVMARQADRTVRVDLHFETEQQASDNLQPRVDLASGDAPGQGGSFAERFAVTAGTADGHDVRLTLRPRSREALLSDLTSGPVLFATC